MLLERVARIFSKFSRADIIRSFLLAVSLTYLAIYVNYYSVFHAIAKSSSESWAIFSKFFAITIPVAIVLVTVIMFDYLFSKVIG